ncbi:MAG: penicillin acylase family protein, partial [Bacteroidota bacterium]
PSSSRPRGDHAHSETNTEDLTALQEHISKVLDHFPLPEFHGSNSWVLAPEKTASGKVLFENDPHIAQAQPSIWYEAHLVTPSYEKYGYYLAGVPFPLLSHDRTMAHGFTMLANDDTNFYYEEQHPTDTTLYKYKDEWLKFDYVDKTIQVKDMGEVPFRFKKTHRGPIVNANHANRTRVKGDKLVSMFWLFTQFENQLVQGLYGINHAANMEEFREALPQIHAPGLNVMYGDAQGNIAWWATAKLYRMPDSTNTKFILDGASGKDDPLAFLDFSDNPSAVNPPSNYVYSANNQPDSIQGFWVPGYYATGRFRAGRIVDLLEAKEKGWTPEDMMTMANDITLRTASETLSFYLSHLDQMTLTEAQINFKKRLLAWPGTYDLESSEALFYQKMKGNLHRALFADEFEDKDTYYSYGVQLKLDKIANLPESPWWDNVSTKDKVETQTEIIQQAFQDTWEQLHKEQGEDPSAWQWGKVHYLEHDHPIGRVAALKPYFTVGPFPVTGTGGTLNNQPYRSQKDGRYKVSSIPSTRRIVDFSDVENSISILPTGQSGNPLSPFYKDQAALFVEGTFRKMMMNKKEIKNGAPHLLVFKPKH